MLSAMMRDKMAEHNEDALNESDYQRQLRLEDKFVYRQKLNLLKGLDPYLLEKTRFSQNVEAFPGISYLDMVNYLVLSSNPIYTAEEMRACKGLEAHSQFTSGWVRDINAEFLRITTVPLQARFFAGLDKKSSQLLQVLRKKGGAIGEKIRDVLKPLDQGVDLNRRRECILKSLVIYLGEEVGHLIKEYLVVQKEEAEAELQNAAMAIFVLRDDDLSPPQDISLVIDGVEVLNNLFSIASACAMLFGLTYAVNLSYPLELKYTFETFQKIIMDIESRQMSKRVQNLSAKLQD